MGDPKRDYLTTDEVYKQIQYDNPEIHVAYYPRSSPVAYKDRPEKIGCIACGKSYMDTGERQDWDYDGLTKQRWECPSCHNFITVSHRKPKSINEIKAFSEIAVESTHAWAAANKKSVLKYAHTDTGFCRVYYTWKNSQGQKVWYCAQEGRPGCDVEFLRCCGDLEPEYEVHPKDPPPLSPGSTSTDKIVNAWIKKKWGKDG